MDNGIGSIRGPTAFAIPSQHAGPFSEADKAELIITTSGRKLGANARQALLFRRTGMKGKEMADRCDVSRFSENRIGRDGLISPQMQRLRLRANNIGTWAVPYMPKERSAIRPDAPEPGTRASANSPAVSFHLRDSDSGEGVGCSRTTCVRVHHRNRLPEFRGFP
jgi:hypothetical protein